jgi:ubiquinone/menaquinone biosynthesis C-methylase UbiE
MATAIDIKDQQRAQWREAADAWDQYFEWYSGAFAPLMTWCADAIGAAPGLRVLDVAAGSGQPSLTIAPRIQPGGTILGIDFSPEMVAVAERRARAAGATNVSFRTMDAEQLELPDATFDAVTCACGIIFFPDAQRALAEMRRVLTGRPDRDRGLGRAVEKSVRHGRRRGPWPVPRADTTESECARRVPFLKT